MFFTPCSFRMVISWLCCGSSIFSHALRSLFFVHLCFPCCCPFSQSFALPLCSKASILYFNQQQMGRAPLVSWSSGSQWSRSLRGQLQRGVMIHKAGSTNSWHLLDRPRAVKTMSAEIRFLSVRAGQETWCRNRADDYSWSEGAVFVLICRTQFWSRFLDSWLLSGYLWGLLAFGFINYGYAARWFSG